MKKLKWLCLLLAAIFFNLSSQAQNSSNKGTEFWVGFMAHYTSRAGMYLYITSDSSTTGEVSIPGKNWSKSFTVTANSMTLVQVPSNLAYVDCSDCIKNQGIKVTSAKKIVVYSHIYYQYRSDATLVLPVQTTGKEYYCMSYDQSSTSHRSQFMIVAKEDSTRIKITPTVDIRSKTGGRLKADQSYYILLDRGEVYQGRAYSGNLSDDVTGTHIEVIDTGVNAKCRTVSVFSGNSYTRLGCSSGFRSGDNLYEQMYPVNSWGKKFVTVPLRGVNSDNLRFMAAEDNTTVLVYSSKSGAKTFTLNAGEYDDLKNVDEAKYVLASGPITVAQYSKTQSCSGGQSDPAMTLINPVEQTLKNIAVYSSRFEDIDDHYINIVIPTQGSGSFRLDGKSVTWTKLGVNQTYSYAREKVAAGNHNLKADVGFVATAYGFGRYESYGYAAGANVKDLTATIELANSTLKDGINLCLGQVAELKGSAEYKVSKYEWDFGDDSTSTLQNPKHLYKDTGTYRVRLYTYKTTFDGCSSYDSAFLNVRVSANPVAKYVSTLACEKGTVSFTDSSKVDDPEKINFIQWKLDKDAEKYGSKTSKYYDSASKYYVQLMVRTENYCFDTIQDSLTINPLPKVSFTADKSCQVDSTRFKNWSTVKSGAIDSFIWDFGTGDSSYKFEPNYLFADSGEHEVVLTAFTDSMCSSSFMDTVYKFQNVDLGFSFNDTCEDMTFDFINSTNFNGANITGSGWVNSLGDSSNNYNYSKLFDSAGTYSIYYWVEIDSFCRDSLVETVTVYPYAEADYLVNKLCEGDSTTFSDNSKIKTGSYTITSWDVDDLNTSTQSSFKVLYKTGGEKDIHLKLTSDKGCVTDLYDKIEIGQIEITDIDIKNVCAGEEQVATPKYNLTKDSITVTGWGFGSNIIFNDTMPKIKIDDDGPIDIVLNITTKKGCTDQFTKNITIYANPSASFTVAPLCDGDDFVITDNSGIPDDASKATYEWYYKGALVSSSVNPSITSDFAASPQLRLITTSEFGCKDTFDLNTSISPNPVAGFSILDSCFGEDMQFIDKSTISSGSISQSDWEFDDATTQSGLTVTKNFATPTSYLVKHKVISDMGCVDSIERSVDVHPLPVLSIAADNFIGCEPFTPSFTNTSDIASGSIINYAWTFGDGQSGVGPTPSHTYNNAGSYNIRVRAVSDKGCVDSIDLLSPITVNTLPTAAFSFTPEKPSILESTVTFTDESIGNMTAWNWDFGDGNSSTDQNPIHEYRDTGLFVVRLTVTNDDGCENFTTKSFQLSPDLFIYIPDGFSPNGDLINDGFGPAGVTAGIKNYEVSVYNRWGEKVFYSTDHNVLWDGTYNGKPLPQGSYLYDMRFTDYKESRWFFKNGQVLLMR